MKSKIILIYIILSLFLNSTAQLPKVDLPIIPTPTEFIYIAPMGNDLNSGSINSPKKTFSSAINSLSFGQAGIDGGNSYVEVILKSGDYYPTGSNSFVQNVNDWRKQVNGVYVYKNISIRGLGKVVIHGDSLSTGSQMIYLSGSGIRVKNLRIENSKLHGVAVVGSNISHHSNIEIDSVHVNGAVDNGIWVTGYDKVLVHNSSTSNTCLRNYKGIGACNWASALRIENGKHATIIKNKVFNNWGEGINTSYVRNTRVQDNEAYDNYSINIYCHSSSNAIYSHNLVHNSDSTFWRYCHNLGGVSGTGISCANELSCTNACFGYGNSCGSLNSCCAELDYDHVLYQNVVYHQTDSVFIFNNIVLNAGISIWDNFSGFNNYANISNYFVHHNTVIGVSGNSSILKPLVNISLGTPFVRYGNINISNNIFSTDTSNLKIVHLNTFVPSGICQSTWQVETQFSTNLWNKKPIVSGLNLSQDNQNSSIAHNITHTNLNPITPNVSNSWLVQSSSKPSYLIDDYYHNTRLSSSNLGALELGSMTAISTTERTNLTVYPNPSFGQFVFNQNLQNEMIYIFDLQGRLQLKIPNFTGQIIDISKLIPGVYFIQLEKNNIRKQFKINIL